MRVVDTTRVVDATLGRARTLGPIPSRHALTHTHDVRSFVRRQPFVDIHQSSVPSDAARGIDTRDTSTGHDR